MKTQTISEKENPLFKRKEIIIALDYDGKPTPSKAELQKLLADELKASLDSVEISKILSEVGISKGKVWVKVWKEKKIANYSEVKKEKSAEAKEEKPKEEPKKEVKAEAKKE